MWKQTFKGGEDVVWNAVQTNTSNVNIRGLSSGKFTIDLQGKQMGWVMGPQSWPLQWRKRAQPLDYFQTDRSEHRGKVYSWKEKTLVKKKKNRLEALGNRNPFSWKKDRGIVSSWPWHPPGWRRHQHRFGLRAAFLGLVWSVCPTESCVVHPPLVVCLVWGPPLTRFQTRHLATLSGWVCFACFRVGRASSLL